MEAPECYIFVYFGQVYFVGKHLYPGGVILMVIVFKVVIVFNS